MSIAEPAKIITPWADTGSKNPIPQNSNNATGAAGYDKGFPDITMTPPEAGGIPPAGQDFNGIFYEVTKILRYMQAGGQPTFSATLASGIGGYPVGAMVLGDDGVAIYTNRVDGNSSNPNSGGSGWAREDLMLREALRRSYAEAGYNLVDGSFEVGGALVNANDVLLQEAGGIAYSWGGALPKIVPPNSISSTTDGWVPRADSILRTDLSRSNGSSLAGFIQAGTGTVHRTAQDKLRELVSAKDFGAVGDGTTDDTVAIQNAINSLSPRGGGLYFPAGYYLISNAITISNIPIVIRGDGMMSSQIIQTTSGKNGFTFTSTTPSNAPVGGGLLVNTFQIEDISINRGAGTGGSAIGLTWAAMTSNTPQFIARNLRVYSKADATNAWAYAISGLNMNGLRMSTCQLHGNPLQGEDAGAEPFTMKAAIRLINTTSDTTGLISFFMDKVTALYCNIGLEINGWHEGFQLNEIEFVQVGRGIVSNGSAAHQNPDMLITNSHIDARVACIDAVHTFKIKVANCDFIKNDATLNGSIIRTVASQYASVVGCSFTCVGTQTATIRAIDADLNSFNWVVSGCHFLFFKDGAINNNSSGWNIGGNQFDDSPTAIALFGALGNNTIGLNTYRNVATPIFQGVLNNTIAPIQYITQATLTVSVAGAQQGFTAPIPSGVFRGKPDAVQVTPMGGSTTLLFSCSYNYASAETTATGVKIEVTGSASIPVGTYIFGITASSRQ